MVRSIVDLYRAGYVHLPAAAYEYGRATSQLFRTTLPTSSRFYPRSSNWFNDGLDWLASILARVRDSLADAGTALVQTARHFQLADAEAAEVIRQIDAIDPPEPGPSDATDTIAGGREPQRTSDGGTRPG